jgi:hypothetical protein
MNVYETIYNSNARRSSREIQDSLHARRNRHERSCPQVRRGIRGEVRGAEANSACEENLTLMEQACRLYERYRQALTLHSYWEERMADDNCTCHALTETFSLVC